MGSWLSYWWKRRVFKYFYFPARLYDGPMELSVLWRRPKGRTFPYDSRAHKFKKSEDGLISFPTLILISVPSSILLESVTEFGNETKGHPTKSAILKNIGLHS